MMMMMMMMMMIITYRTPHSSRPNIVVFDKTIKESCSVDVAITDSHKFYSTITEKLHKYRDLKEELIRMWQLKTANMMSLVPSTMGYVSK